MFPYHLGVITSLEHHGRITDSVHLAGASAGAIAVASHASKTPAAASLEAAFRVCDACETQHSGRAAGKLLPLLQHELEKTFSPDAHTIINGREGVVALAHRELFPNNRPVLATHFDTREDLIEAVCDSSMFPFFSTAFPVRLKYKEGMIFPRVVVDGFFSVPRYDRPYCHVALLLPRVISSYHRTSPSPQSENGTAALIFLTSILNVARLKGGTATKALATLMKMTSAVWSAIFRM